MSDTQPIKLNESNFEEHVKKSKTPVVVDFWAEWCPPCRVLGPTIDKLASESSGQFKVGKVDIDVDPGLAQAYEIRSIPTILIFVEGEVVERIVGVVSQEEIEKALNQAAHVA